MEKGVILSSPLVMIICTNDYSILKNVFLLLLCCARHNIVKNVV